MKYLCTTALLLFLAFSLQAENVFDNSNMDSSGAWRGDRKFKEIEGNRVIEIEADKNRKLGFFQNAKTRGVTEAIVKFRYRSSDYKGNGMDIRAQNHGAGGIFYTIQPKTDGQWHEMTLKFHKLEKMSEASFVFSLNRGEGTVIFDDITLTLNK